MKLRRKLHPDDIFFRRTWSYGDVEANGVYYHPALTNYAHQAFEERFYETTGLHYAELSRVGEASDERRCNLSGEPSRMTFPVVWLHQFMRRAMYAGDEFGIAVDVIDLDATAIGVRAWVAKRDGEVVAAVFWHRCAILLPTRDPIPIPSWFPRLRLADDTPQPEQ